MTDTLNPLALNELLDGGIEKRQAATIFIEAGFAYLNAISDEDVCSDRSCIRCRIADVLFETENRWKESEAV